MLNQYIPDPFYDTPEWLITRNRVLNRDHFVCQYCNGKAHQADHIVPRKRGGNDTLHNLVACCATCNKTAGNHTFVSFMAKKEWVLANRLKDDTKEAKPFTGRRPKKPEYPTKPKKRDSIFKSNLKKRRKGS